MIRDLVSILTLAAQFLAILAYWPQIHHLLKEKSSQGMNVTSWLLWVISNAMLFIYGLVIGDFVIIISQLLFTGLNITVLTLAVRYRVQRKAK